MTTDFDAHANSASNLEDLELADPVGVEVDDDDQHPLEVTDDEALFGLVTYREVDDLDDSSSGLIDDE